MVDVLLVVYSVAEICLSMIISISNFVVIVAYLRARHIRKTPTNAYIFSLAITDFLAGSVGIPLTVTSVLTKWPFAFFPCLAIHLILCVLCTVSTFHLLAMAVHKYLSICQTNLQRSLTNESIPIRHVNLVIIGAWAFGTFLGSLPLMDGFGFASKTINNFKDECHFTDVVDYRYLVFIIFFGTIVFPSIIIAFCYTSIYSYIQEESRPIQCHLQAAQLQRRNNSTRKLIRTSVILVTTFAICWYPLYIINTLDLFFNLNAGRPATLVAVVLSHANCALNPMIYAYGVPGFKQSLRRYFPFFAPVSNISMQGTGAGGACGVPLPGINAHAAWYDNLSAAKKRASSCAIGACNGYAAFYCNGTDNSGRIMSGDTNGGAIGMDRRRSMAAQIGGGGTPHHHQHQQHRRQQQFGRRTVSTAVNPSPSAAFSNAMALGSSLSSHYCSRATAQFRRQHNTVLLLHQPQQSHQQNSTETDETEDADDELQLQLQLQQQQHHSSFSDNSVGTNCSTTNEIDADPDERTTTDRKRSGQSIASRVSAWSLRIFNGHWRVLRRRTSSVQSLKEIGTMVVEKRSEMPKMMKRKRTTHLNNEEWEKLGPNNEEQQQRRVKNDADQQ